MSGRSMKAGAFTPATPVAGRCVVCGVVTALNEGGGFHPRNPDCRRTFNILGSYAQ